MKLLLRSTRSVSLTEEGAAYYEQVGLVMARLAEADSAAREHSGGPSGRVRVDVHSSMAHALLIPALPEFRRLHPGIQLAIGISDRPIRLIEEGVDCVIRLGRLADTSLISRTLYEDRLITCASPAYLAGRTLPETPEDLHGHDLVGYFSATSGAVVPLQFEQAGRAVHLSQVQVLANDSAGQIGMVLAGLGIGQVFHSTVRAHLEAGRLVPLLEGWTTGAAPISLLYPPSRTLNARTRIFIDWFIAHLKQVGG